MGQLFSLLPSWKPTSESLLEEAEKEVLKGEGSDGVALYPPHTCPLTCSLCRSEVRP